MKLAVDTCEPGPGRLVPIFAVPSTRSPSTATTVRPGAASTHMPYDCSAVIAGS